MAITAAATAPEEGGRQLVTFLLGSTRYGVPIEAVDEIAMIQRLEPIRGAPPFMRGLMRVRERVIPVLDLRRRVSMPSLDEEREALIGMLQERRADHIRWLEALERSVREGVRFDLATNPHQCAFGRWYDHFETDDPVFSHHLEKFDEPHRRIHAIATRCLDLRAQGDVETAIRIIEETRSGYLSDMLVLFDGAVAILRDRTRELVVIVRTGSTEMGLLVDRVDSVVAFDAAHEEPPPPGGLATETVAALVKEGDGSVIQVLDLEALVPGPVG